MRRRALAGLLWGLAVVITFGSAVVAQDAAAAVSDAPESAAPGPPLANWRLERDGVELELELASADDAAELEMRESENVLFRLAISDTATGQPLGGLYPAVWMAKLAPGEGNDPGRCTEKVQEYVGGSILARPELDLNVYFVMALNDDATISVVDPLFGFGGTQLLAMVQLPGQGYDWALTPDTGALLVTVPTRDRLAVVNAISWKLANEIEIPGSPGRVALQPDGRYLWVSVRATAEAPAGVAVVDTRELIEVARIPTGEGPHEMAITDDSRYAVVANRGAGSVTVIDIASLEATVTLATGDSPTSIDYSPLARAAYVTHDGDGTIAVIDPYGGRQTGTIDAEPGLGRIRFATGGRLGFIVNPKVDALHILDASSNRIVQSGDTKSGPDRIAFSDRLGYVSHRDTELVLMVPLDQVGVEGEPVPMPEFPGGQEPFGLGRFPSPAARIVQAPGEDAVLVANPIDKVIYYYREGMAAPMGAFQNFERQPRAVLVVDRSLRERNSPGIYQTTARLREPGRYQIALFLDTPRIVHCFDALVTPDPVLQAERDANRPPLVESLAPEGGLVAGRETKLSVRLLDPVTRGPRTGLEDVLVVVWKTSGWNNRQWAQEGEPGVYSVRIVPPAPGRYTFAVESPSAKLGFHQSPRTALEVAAAGETDAAGDPAGDTP